MQNTSPIFTLIPLSLCLLPYIGTHPWKRPVFPSCISFLEIKCILILQGDFTLVLQACVYHALIKLNVPSHHYLLILCHHAPLIFNNFDKKF
jgi:hypothetical protein